VDRRSRFFSSRSSKGLVLRRVGHIKAAPIQNTQKTMPAATATSNTTKTVVGSEIPAILFPLPGCIEA
jgi:hypothetical protein